MPDINFEDIKETKTNVLKLTLLAFAILFVIFLIFSYTGRERVIPSSQNISSEPTLVDNTPKATQDVLMFTGNSQKATEQFELQPGLRRAEFKHTGDSNFIATLLDEQGKPAQLLVNHIGAIEGSKAFSSAGGKYVIDVYGSGEWSITIK